MKKKEVEILAGLKKEVEISNRMKALTRLVTPGRVVCDIGCDHGFVSIYLVQKGISQKVLAMDVRSGPLSQAQSHILEYGLEAEVETRLSDGLQKLEMGEADCMICAGMGGPLMIKILEEGREKALAMKELILQPQSEIAQFREYLRTNGYHIIEEDMVLEDGKYYPMMKVAPEGKMTESGAQCREENDRVVIEAVPQAFIETTGVKKAGDPEQQKQQVFDLYGQYLLEQKHPILKQYLEHSAQVLETLQGRLKEQQSQRALARLPEVETELELLHIALGYFRE